MNDTAIATVIVGAFSVIGVIAQAAINRRTQIEVARMAAKVDTDKPTTTPESTKEAIQTPYVTGGNAITTTRQRVGFWSFVRECWLVIGGFFICFGNLVGLLLATGPVSRSDIFGISLMTILVVLDLCILLFYWVERKYR